MQVWSYHVHLTPTYPHTHIPHPGPCCMRNDHAGHQDTGVIPPGTVLKIYFYCGGLPDVANRGYCRLLKRPTLLRTHLHLPRQSLMIWWLTKYPRWNRLHETEVLTWMNSLTSLGHALVPLLAIPPPPSSPSHSTSISNRRW